MSWWRKYLIEKKSIFFVCISCSLSGIYFFWIIVTIKAKKARLVFLKSLYGNVFQNMSYASKSCMYFEKSLLVYCVFIFLLVFLWWLSTVRSFSSINSLQEITIQATPVNKQRLLQSAVMYHQRFGNTHLIAAYNDLLLSRDQEDNLFARRKIDWFISWLEKRYPFLVDDWKQVSMFFDQDGNEFVPPPTIRTPSSQKNNDQLRDALFTATLYATEDESLYDISTKSQQEDTTTHRFEQEVSSSSMQGEFPVILYTVEKWSIDVWQLHRAWQWWVNELRAKRNLETLRLQSLLYPTAAERSQHMKQQWVANHKRTPTSSYYNYREITERFAERWLVFINDNRATYTENVWWWVFRCRVWDCTQEALDTMHRIFTFFRNEEWQQYDPHRRTMIQPFFREFALWIAVDQTKNRLYLTIHYAVWIDDGMLDEHID